MGVFGKPRRFILGILLTGLLYSCTTLQEDQLISTADDLLETELMEIADLIVPLDTDPSSGRTEEARKKISVLEERSIGDAVFAARLAAWSGRLFLIEGKKEPASNRLEYAKGLAPETTAVAVLEARMISDPEKRLGEIETSIRLLDGAPELVIEKARTFLELSQYREAVAAFDTAMSSLPPVYSQTYSAVRDSAWELRNMDSDVLDSTAAVAAKTSVTWKEAVETVQAETNLFDFITGGELWNADDILPKLRELDITPPASFPASDPDSRMLRGGAAWFLWHIHAAYTSQPGLLTVYSERFAGDEDPKSPIPDVPLDKPWFDSVLGCIEWEFMTLPDGRRFYPGRPVTGSEFIEMLKALQ